MHRRTYARLVLAFQLANVAHAYVLAQRMLIPLLMPSDSLPVTSAELADLGEWSDPMSTRMSDLQWLTDHVSERTHARQVVKLFGNVARTGDLPPDEDATDVVPEEGEARA